MTILLVALSASALTIQYRFRGHLQIWFFDVGQGDATFIQTPHGKQILIDGGPDDVILQKLASVMIPWDRSIDVVVPTHPDADHITGLASVLRWYEVETVIETGARATTPQSQTLTEAIDAERATRRLIKAGDRFLYDDVLFEVLWPEQTLEGVMPSDRNNSSIVMRVTYGDTTILFTGDLEEEVESQRAWPDVDVLKAGHHGSVSSSSPAFLRQVKPEVTILLAGEENRYGHPHPVVLERLRTVSSTIYRTDQDGEVLLTSEGGEPSVRPYPLPF